MKFLKTIFPVLLALLVGMVLYQLIDFEKLFDELQKANIWLVIIPCFIMLFAHYLRAVRMNLLLKAVGYKTSDWNTSLAVVVGYLANLILPRMGEVTRCTIIQRTNQIPANVSIGVVVTERIVDVLCVLVCLVLCLFLEYNVIYDFVLSILPFKNIEVWKLILAVCILLILGFIVVLIIKKQANIFLENKWIKKVLELFIGFKSGVLSVFKLQTRFLFFLLSVGIWFSYALLTWILLLAFEPTQNLSASVGLVVNTMGAFGMAVPVQGGIGAYHFMVQSVLLLYQIPAQIGLICATLLHSSQMLATIIFGSIAGLILLFNKK